MRTNINQNSVILTISFSQFVMPLMFSGVGITLPSVGRELEASGVQLGMIESLYLGAAAASLLPLGRLSDLTDKKTIFKIGLIIYTLLTLLLGFSPQIELFLGLRLLQGMAGGMLLATNMAILSELVPKENLGKAIGIAIGSVYLGLTTGPFIAGIITTNLGWRYVYYLGGILIGVVALTSLLNIPSDKKMKLVKIDLVGSFLIITAISLIVAGSSILNQGVLGYVLLGSGIVLMALFIYSQTRVADPLISLEVITSNRRLKSALLVQLINYAGTFGITFLFSLYLQTIKQMTPQEAGVVLMISPIIMACFAPIFGRISDRVSPEKITFVGMCFCLISTLIALTVNATTSMWIIYLQFSSMGLGFAMFSSPNMNIIMSSVEKRFLGMASAIVAELRSLGMVISLTVITISLSIYLGQNELTIENASNYLQAMHFSILTFASLMAIGVAISLHSLKKKSLR
jgi:MFS family permease